MATLSPFYTLNQLVHHTNDQCPQAKLIAPAHQLAGMGGKVECLCCRHLNRLERKKGISTRFIKRFLSAKIR